ncbi:P-loop containing nucleoside triphosphate hydrolase protein [Daedaleopsis nitida]|nr:P-loop containing nucleoside triphosphate hydrolase protein [Daedaleopsis nitida]
MESQPFVGVPQIPLTASSTTLLSIPAPDRSLWQDTLVIPAYIAGVSFLVLVAESLSHYASTQKRAHETNSEEIQHNEADLVANHSFLGRTLTDMGGTTIFVFRLVQELAVLGVLGLSIGQLVTKALGTAPSHYEDPSQIVLEAVQCALYIYLSVLGLFSLFGKPSVNYRAYLHLTWLLVCVWSVYLYRDIWPLATYDIVPTDGDEGRLLWIKVVLLSIAGVVIPVTVPRKYTPVNDKEILEPHPEQTASAMSFLTFTFISPTIWQAYRVPHLTLDQFPPLPDRDHLQHMSKRMFPYLDPMLNKSRRHLGLRLIKLYWVELCQLSMLSVTIALGMFATPLCLNKILGYLERDEQTTKPWLWILLLFVGQVMRTVAEQVFAYIESRLDIRIKSIFTELVFEHSLRLRMKADGSSSSNGPPPSEDPAIVNNAAVSDGIEEERDPSEEGLSGTDAAAATDAPVGAKAVELAVTADMPDSADKEDKNTIGRINNLVSSDVSALAGAATYVIFLAVETPFQMIVCITFLYKILGWSAFIGVASTIIMFPLSGYLAKFMQGTQRDKMKRTDARVQQVTETINTIRMIKLFGWERRIASQLDKKREEELVYVGKSRMLQVFYGIFNAAIPILIMLTTFGTYAVVMKGSLTAAKIFSARSVLGMFSFYLQIASNFVPRIIEVKVAIERIQDFFENTELIDQFVEPMNAATTTVLFQEGTPPDIHHNTIGIRRASFTWAINHALSAAKSGNSRRTYVLRIEDEVIFQPGKVNLIVGPTGAGKTSMLMALLGEMHYIPAGPDSFVSLPRAGGIAYAAQESWVQNDTIRNNIVFTSPFDEVRYKKVLDQCALTRDLELFDAGDQTEVGEKGITLSGGQKARISLARAIYSDAQTLLLDDILAALDVHTSRWIVNRCLKGDLVKGRTIIMVTHSVAIVSPITDYVVDLGSDGRIVSQGSLSSALAKDAALYKELQEEQQELEKVEQEVDSTDPADKAAEKSTGKLVVDEEVEIGRVGWAALKLFFGNITGHPVWFWVTYISWQGVRQVVSNSQIWYLGVWAAQYETHLPEEVPVWHYLTVYTVLVLLGMTAIAISTFYFVYSSLKSSRIVHQKLIVSVLSATLRWLDKTPASRIIARCTGDIRTVDGDIVFTAEQLTNTTMMLIFTMGGAVFFSPIFLGPAILLALAGGLCGHIYMKAQLSVQREMSNAKAPVLGHFGAAITGITSIRAYGAQDTFKAESYKRVDRHARAAITDASLKLWMTVRVDSMAALFTSGLAFYLTYISHLSASNTGFSLSMATTFSSNIFSLERIQQYLTIEHEPEPTPEGVPPAYWPASGRLEVKNLSARYSVDGPKVLHDVTFEIAPGERVGIVGRTGSGKSSLTLALLRCILTEGTVKYDGLSIDRLNLDALRSNVTIIPQVPELLSGTLRQNLDPFSEHSDAVLNDALRSAGLFSLQTEDDQSRITLDTDIAGGGANLSVGQRQILALARAIVRHSKLLILDEATSAIDYETDSIIQQSLRTELGKDVTLLTVAHRLQTIMDADKIMVLDAGRIAEFGKPSELLKNDKGMLRALVDESGDKEKLYTMAAVS